VRVLLHIFKEKLEVCSDLHALVESPFLDSLALIDTLFPSFTFESELLVLLLSDSWIEHTVESLLVQLPLIKQRVQQLDVHLLITGLDRVISGVEVPLLAMAVKNLTDFSVGDLRHERPHKLSEL